MTSLINQFKECNYKICTDSRKIYKDCLFFCLKGDNFDAHDFIDEIIDNGAKYIIVDNEKFSNKDKCIKVENCLKSLQDLAKEYRENFNIPIITIGGSNGKTTTKELLNKVLSTKYKTHATKSNNNNHLGVPLTLLNMPIDTEIAIIEIGANHKNEHNELLKIIKPNYVFITNNGKDHLEGFGDIEGVKYANYEIYNYAKENNLKVFIPNYEDDLLEKSKMFNKDNIIEFGYNDGFISKTEIYSEICLNDLNFKSNLFGKFNEKNMITAISIGKYFNCDILKIKESINNYNPEILRSQIKVIDNIKYFIDCYNANPSSMIESIKSFENIKSDNKSIILGDMLELGIYANDEHKNILNYVKNMNLKLNIFVGNTFKLFEKEFPEFFFFENVDKAKDFWFSENRDNCEVLIKGSNSIGLKNIFN